MAIHYTNQAVSSPPLLGPVRKRINQCQIGTSRFRLDCFFHRSGNGGSKKRTAQSVACGWERTYQFPARSMTDCLPLSFFHTNIYTHTHNTYLFRFSEAIKTMEIEKTGDEMEMEGDRILLNNPLRKALTALGGRRRRRENISEQRHNALNRRSWKKEGKKIEWVDFRKKRLVKYSVDYYQRGTDMDMYIYKLSMRGRSVVSSRSLWNSIQVLNEHIQYWWSTVIEKGAVLYRRCVHIVDM